MASRELVRGLAGPSPLDSPDDQQAGLCAQGWAESCGGKGFGIPGSQSWP